MEIINAFVLPNATACKFLLCLFAFMILDFVTGSARGYLTGTYASKKGREGLIRKFLYVAVIIASYLIGAITNAVDGVMITICTALIAVEGASLIENLGQCGVPVPEFLKSAIESLNKKEEEETKGSHEA